MSSSTSSPARLSRRTLRQRRIVALLAVLGLIGVLVWLKVIHDANDINTVAQCPQPAASGSQWQQMPYTALDPLQPEPTNAVRMRVLNAGPQRGLAERTDAELQQLGFVSTAQPGNDPVYPGGGMSCVGQIRFGPAGQAAARTLSLAVPCTQLIRDDRHDDTVDLALGTDFADVTPNPAAHQVLQQLAAWSQRHPQPTGGLQTHAESTPRIDAGLLTNARTTEC